MGATVARKNKKQAAWEKEAAKRKRKAALAVRTKKFTDIPEGVSPEDAGVIISRAVTSTEVRIINEYFHKYLTNVGPRATAVPKKPSENYSSDAVCYIAKDPNGLIIGGVNSIPNVALTSNVAPKYAMRHGLTHIEAVLTVAQRIRSLAHLVVIPEYQNKGIGSLLVTAVENHERAAGVVDWFGLAEGDGPKLRRFYERHGFEVRDSDEPEEFIIPGLPNTVFVQDGKVHRSGYGFRKSFTENSW